MNTKPEPGSSIDFQRPCRLTIERTVYASAETGRALYKVHNDHDGLSYALKVIPAATSTELDAVRRETVALNRQNQHPDRLPRFRGCFFRDGFAHVLLDWIEGTPLDQVTRGTPVTNEAEVGLRLELAFQSCETIALLHKNGFKHRDVKPANLLARDARRPDRGVAVVDLGLSTQPRSEEEGTRGFQAPEQFGMRNQNLTTATDVFALAQVTWYLLTGGVRQLLQAEGEQAWRSIGPTLAERIPSVRTLHGLEPVLLKAIEFRPERRYPNAAAFASAARAAARTANRERQ
jgi:serine/threonine protein kinase